jgi:hypothetical protein
VTTLRIRCRRLLEPDAGDLKGLHLDSTLSLPAPAAQVSEAVLPCSCGAEAVVSLAIESDTA